MKYKVGQVLYKVTAYEEAIDTDEWVVRTIRGGRVFAIIKTSFTWVKLSRAHFDWGWAKDIPDYCRDSCREGGKFMFLHTTKLAAIRDELKNEYTEERFKPRLRSMITRERNKRKK